MKERRIVMKLKEILDHDYHRIIYRTYLGEIDMLCGYCAYEDGELKSLDEDTYSLDDEITKYEYDEDMDELVVWVPIEWSYGGLDYELLN